MSGDDFKPVCASECWDLCPECGEQLDFDGTCCVLGCVAYERAMGRGEMLRPEVHKVVDLFDALRSALGKR